MPVLNSPNMNLPIPVVGQEPGPQYATDVNSCLTLVDGHNHTPGYGAAIPSTGLNINADLTFNGFGILALSGATFTAQSGTPANNTIYEKGVDLYFVDGLGNDIQLTINGAVAGTPGSISNLVPPASASYVGASKTFFWQSNISIAANMDFASAILRNISPNSTFGLTLQPPAALTSNYTLTLPSAASIPVSTSFMTLDSAGTMSTGPTVLGALTTANLSPSANILGTQLDPSANILKSQLSAVGQQFSTSSGVFTTGSGSYVPVTNLSVTITSTGKPIMVMLLPDGSGNVTKMTAIDSAGGTAIAQFEIKRDATTIATNQIGHDPSASASNKFIACPFQCMDVIGAGSYTYTVNILVQTGTGASVEHFSLVAYEIA